ncbi:MAG: RNA methyltransferase [Bacteroidota bacterium]|nr:RNA methyltransferase [Bacteroidota bacterium]
MKKGSPYLRELNTEYSDIVSDHGRTLTTSREQKMRTLVANRQLDVTLVLENIDDPHNINAILRTADSVGIHEVMVIRNQVPKKKLGKRSSASAKKWVNMVHFTTAAECIEAIKLKNMALYCTHLDANASQLYQVDFTQPIAIALGNELRGISNELLLSATGNIWIPMLGMIPSLNVSVASAVIAAECMRQRMQKNMYPQPWSAERDVLFNDYVNRLNIT